MGPIASVPRDPASRRWTNNGPRVARASGGSDFTHKQILFSRKIVDSRARNKEFIGIKLAVIEVDPDYEWLAPYFLLLFHDVTFNCCLVEDHLPESQNKISKTGFGANFV
jgi:hypothetical protein